jgi:DNA-binding response OmpR family regulator
MILKDKNFLVVSDPNAVIDGICSRLRTKGIGIEFCSSGFQAISNLERIINKKEKMYDLMIIFKDSYDMPAREILNLTRINASKIALPILVMAEASNTDDIIELMNEGANEYLADFQDFSKLLAKS